jgi:hypothetical protein
LEVLGLIPSTGKREKEKKKRWCLATVSSLGGIAKRTTAFPSSSFKYGHYLNS